MSQLYTVIALDQDYDNCDVKYIGVFSNYELAKGAADAHSITYGKSTIYDSKYEYKIFLSTLDEGVNIDTEKDLLYKEKEEKYAKYMEDQKLANEKIIKAQQKENKSQILHIKEIVRLLDFNIEVDQLTAIEKDSIIMFFDLYFELMCSSYHGYASRSIVLKAVNNFNIFLEIVKKYNFQTNEYLQFMLDVYKNHGIKVG